MNFYVLKSIEFGPAVFQKIYAKINPGFYDAHPDPERFSPREIIAHLADWEPIFRGRMGLILFKPGALIIGQDESERAIKNRYHEQDIEANLAQFAAERAKTTNLVRSLEPNQFELQGNREGYGPMSVEDYANLLVCHDMYHVEQILEFL